MTSRVSAVLARRVARALLAVAVLVVFGAAASAQARDGATRQGADGAQADDAAILRHCIVCDGPAGDDPIIKTFDGRRVAVCRGCGEESWQRNRDDVMAKMQARGALFDEKATVADDAGARSLVSGWMWFGIWALAGIVCAAAATYVALSKGLEPLPWLLAALAFNVVALALVVSRRRGDLSQLPQGVPAGLAKIATTHAPVACSKCGAANHPSASTCTSCGAPLASHGESEVSKAARVDAASRPHDRRAR